MPPARILVVDDDPLVPRTLRIFLQKHGHDVRTAPGAEEALRLLEESPAEVVLTDIAMPGPDGHEVLRRVKKRWPQTQVVLVTGYGTIDGAVKGMRDGAFDYVTKPVNDEEMLIVVERALEHARLRSENAELRAALDKQKGTRKLVGSDTALGKVLETVDAVAPTRATVLVTGESGTGKSMIARLLHDASRRGGPFCEVNCGAIPEGLLESELFGHAKGAFTGAVASRQGKFLAADHGTLFLDEIGASTPALQLKLLHAIQERRFQPVGSEESVEVDVRLVLATNEDLVRAVAEGRFRQDLYYRINVVPVHLPPLRERSSDVPLLAHHFLLRFAQAYGKEVREISHAAMTVLSAHDWPGNVRELENAVERAVVLARGPVVEPGDLPNALTRSAPAPTADRALPLKRALEIPEREIIERTLRMCGWNRQKTARALDINRTTLFNKMRKYGLLDRRGTSAVSAP